LAAAVAVAVTFCASGTPPAFAAPDSTPASRDQIEDRRQALLRLMLQDPTNLDVAFEYAALSSQVGDYEAAVSTLERMLIFAPNTPRLQLELGILYYRLGSYEVSRSYFAQVVANPNVPPETAEKVRLYLQQLAIEADPPPLQRHDLQRHSLGEQCELSPGFAGRHPEWHRLHPRFPIGRRSRLERRQYRHDALWLRLQEPG
jgi:tetratricopeptide (TPR) repeat protein